MVSESAQNVPETVSVPVAVDCGTCQGRYMAYVHDKNLGYDVTILSGSPPSRRCERIRPGSEFDGSF